MNTYNSDSTGSSSHKPNNCNTDNMIQVVGYCRVSTDMQAQHGLSLDAQKQTIQRYAADRGWVVGEIFVDGGFSGKNTDRPAFRQMIRAVKESHGRIKAIVVTKLDRLTRSLRDVLTINEDLLEPHGCNLVAIHDGINTFETISKMLLPFLAIVGQMERTNTAERVRATVRHIRDQGGHYGKVPFGYMTVEDGRYRRLAECPDTYPWLQRIIGWYRDSVPMPQIAERMNEAGIKPRYGNPRWTGNKIYELLRTMRVHKTRAIESEATYDKQAAYRVAYELRSDGRELKFIADELNRRGLRPLKAGSYSVSAVQDLLRSAVYHDRSTPRGLALYLKEQGCSLREIGKRLAEAGHFPPRGGQWYPQTVKLLFVS